MRLYLKLQVNRVAKPRSLSTKIRCDCTGTYENLRSRIAEDLAINRLRQQQVMSRIKISDQDVDNFLKSPQGQAALGNQAHVIHMRISGDNPQEVQNVAKKFVHNLLKTMI